MGEGCNEREFLKNGLIPKNERIIPAQKHHLAGHRELREGAKWWSLKDKPSLGVGRKSKQESDAKADIH